MGRKKTSEQFAKEMESINPSIELIGVYVASSERILVRCKECGYEWEPVAAELSRGRGCPKCKGKVPLQTAEFIERMQKVNASIEITGEYVRSNEKIGCRCLICGHEWSASPNSLLRGHGCPKCADIANGARRRKTHEQYVAELAVANPDITVLGHYENSAKPVMVKCKTCGHIWSPIARSILNTGQGCPVCSQARAVAKRRKSPDSFVAEMKLINPNIEIVSKYKSSKEKVECRCLVCHNEWKAAPGNLLSGYGCPRCASTGTSFMEQFLCVFLENIFGADEVLSRDKSAIGRELDIYLPKNRVAIEMGSWYWHKNRLDSDIQKETECVRHKIDLITIYDCCPESIEEQIPNHSQVFTFSLAEEEGHVHLREIAEDISQKLGADRVKNIDWSNIEKEASARSLPKQTEDFVKEMAMLNPDISILGEYLGSKRKLLCRCEKCGNEWGTTPHQLFRGQGCPSCSRKRASRASGIKHRKSPERFRLEFESANPTLTLLSEYRGAQESVCVKCDVCGHEWSPRAEATISGNGCPVCADNAKRKTHSEFLAELSATNPNIEVIGSYVKNSTPIEVRCKTCGYIWHPQPSKLLGGRGCPKCAGKMKTKVRCIETGHVYESYAAAALAVGLSSGDSISSVCKGKQKTAAGYRWERVQRQ